MFTLITGIEKSERRAGRVRSKLFPLSFYPPGRMTDFMQLQAAKAAPGGLRSAGCRRTDCCDSIVRQLSTEPQS